jgi:hypothetical protein
MPTEMTLGDVLQMLNSGGLQVVGTMVLAVIIWGIIVAVGQIAKLVKFLITEFLPEFMAKLNDSIRQVGADSKESAEVYKATTEKALAQQAEHVDKLMEQNNNQARSFMEHIEGLVKGKLS